MWYKVDFLPRDCSISGSADLQGPYSDNSYKSSSINFQVVRVKKLKEKSGRLGVLDIKRSGRATTTA